VERRRLGRYGPEVSVVGLGAWEAGGDAWGPNPSDEEVVRAIRTAFDAGMNWVDTAEVYGGGRSEELVGRAVAGIRDEVLIFTKVGGRDSGSGFRPEDVKRAIRGSLRRLGTDYVDLYQIHWPDPEVPIEETWGAMAELVEEGLARYVGVSNFDREQVERCLAIRHVDSVQNQFSLLKQDDRAELLPWLEERGVGYLAYAPLAFGLLTGAIRADTVFDSRDWRSGTQHQGEAYRNLFAPGRREEKLALVERLRQVADRLGVPLATLALRWVVEQRGVTAAIAGSRNPGHVRTNALAGDLRLDPGTVAEIDEIFS
jgi:aryl-alcohol dehydrogenase-like predicted oxidoreductase